MQKVRIEMEKCLDLSLSVYELTEQYPELIEVMASLGFTEITKKAMLHSVGKLMTIPRGAKMKQIPMERVIATLLQHGFTLSGDMPASVVLETDESDAEAGTAALSAEAETGAAGTSQAVAGTDAQRAEAETGVAEISQAMAGTGAQSAETAGDNETAQTRIELLKGYLRRLGEGEALEQVREDFVAAFRDVDASEIMRAEQEMMSEGTPLSEVQKLCDIHSALFHGATREEQIANAEAAALASMRAAREKVAQDGPSEEAIKALQLAAAAQKAHSYAGKNEKAAAFAQIVGHPLYTFTRENEALAPLLTEAKAQLDAGQEAGELIERIREISIHYAKKGDLLYPHLKVKYEISGPSSVMWTVDDEIRDELSALVRAKSRDEQWSLRVKLAVQRAEEMIYKESNILFPICAANFTTEEWYGIYQDAKDYAVCLGVEQVGWPEAEAYLQVAGSQAGPGAGADASAKTEASATEGSGIGAQRAGEIVMPGGHMRLDELTAMLNTIPLEISFVDADNINRYFNEGPKVFKRPAMAIDREVFSCHPPKIEPMVRAILDDFRNQRRDRVQVWMEKGGRTMLVTYMAVRNAQKEYLGTVELVQDMEEIKEHFLKKQ